ncbi:helicase-associated domain-containing protein [bacterium]|nr:helicase-associated domain-containing protein [bacterium]
MSDSLLHCLSQLSMEQNRRIALRIGLWPKTNSKQTLMREVYGRLLDPQYLGEALEGLDDDERLALEHLVRRVRRHPENGGEAPRLLFGLFGTRTGRAVHVLSTLAEKGFLFPRGEGEEIPSLLPGELVERLAPLIGAAGGPWGAPRREPPARVFAGQSRLAHDVISVLAYARKNRVRMTQGGEVFSRVRERLAALCIARREAFPPGLAEALAPQRRDVESILAFAAGEGYIEEEQQRILVAEAALARLRTLSLLDLCREFLRSLERGWLFHYSMHQRLLEMLREAEPARWYDLDALLDEVAGKARTPDRAARRSSLFALLGLLHDLSVLDFGCDAAGADWALRVSPAGWAMLCDEPFPPAERLVREVHALPDFTVLAPLEVEADERWQLESFADLVSADTIFTYRISRQSIYRALQDGVEVESILAFFVQHGERRLPQNVEYSVREWAASFGRIHFADVLLLRCDSEELAAEVAASPDIRRFIEGQITPRDLLVSRGGYEEIVKYLEKMGHLPKTLRK